MVFVINRLGRLIVKRKGMEERASALTSAGPVGVPPEFKSFIAQLSG
jgi:hypothetical protein